jgi:hypothetical protein
VGGDIAALLVWRVGAYEGDVVEERAQEAEEAGEQDPHVQDLRGHKRAVALGSYIFLLKHRGSPLFSFRDLFFSRYLVSQVLDWLTTRVQKTQCVANILPFHF